MTNELVAEMVRREGQLRLGLLRGMDSALRRHQEVFAAIAASANRAEASAAIQALLGLDPTQAQAVLSLQWDRLTKEGVEEIADQVARQAVSVDPESAGAAT